MKVNAQAHHGRSFPILEALLVTFLWSSSYVLIKMALVEVTPMLFAAIRYSMASIILIAVNVVSTRNESWSLTKNDILMLVAAGFFGYTVAQGLQIVGLLYLPATMVTLVLNFTPVFVLLMEVMLLREAPTSVQVVGVLTALSGALLYFSDQIGPANPAGIALVLVSGIGWAAYLIILRRIQRSGTISSMRLTGITMTIGTLGIVALVPFFEPFRVPSISAMLILVWLSVVNTALAFYLWNQALRFLRAYELSILQNSMLVQIAILSFLFLGESITGTMMAGMILVLAGIVLVQVTSAGKWR
jgi:drug/metabolite transporter (DMT)-like permease